MSIEDVNPQLWQWCAWCGELWASYDSKSQRGRSCSHLIAIIPFPDPEVVQATHLIGGSPAVAALEAKLHAALVDLWHLNHHHGFEIESFWTKVGYMRFQRWIEQLSRTEGTGQSRLELMCAAALR